MPFQEQLKKQLKSLHLEVSEQHQQQLQTLLPELRRWNRRINLTAITSESEGIEKHLVDSLTLLPLLEGAHSLLDLGSGGGFPCLPVKICRPDLQVYSVDAIDKKLQFQRHIARQLNFEEFVTLHRRAEELSCSPRCTDGFDVVVSRAFTALEKFAAFALPCLAPGGRIVAMKGPEGERELEQCRQELAHLGLVESAFYRLTLPESKSERTLIVLQQKTSLPQNMVD